MPIMQHSPDSPVALVSQHVEGESIDDVGHSTAATVHLVYDPDDPFAVTTSFETPDGHIRWTFSRTLLSVGVFEPTGDGDVQVWPCLDFEGRAVVLIELHAPVGEVLFQLRAQHLNQFVRQMESVVPPGTESAHLGMDSVIAALLDASAP